MKSVVFLFSIWFIFLFILYRIIDICGCISLYLMGEFANRYTFMFRKMKWPWLIVFNCLVYLINDKNMHIFFSFNVPRGNFFRFFTQFFVCLIRIWILLVSGSIMPAFNVWKWKFVRIISYTEYKPQYFQVISTIIFSAPLYVKFLHNHSNINCETETSFITY